MGAKPPAFQFYPKDFLTDAKCARLSDEEAGIYIRMMSMYWIEGRTLPSDLKVLAEMLPRTTYARLKKAWVRLAACWTVDRDVLKQPSLDRRTEQYAQFIAAASESGKRGAERKWGPGGSSPATRSQRLAAARSRGRHSKLEWDALLEIVGESCLRCGGGPVIKDHIIPLYQDDSSDAIENLQPLCAPCNWGKNADRTDYRPPGTLERLAERLGSSWKTPSETHGGTPSRTPSSPSATSTASPENSALDTSSRAFARFFYDAAVSAGVLQAVVDPELWAYNARGEAFELLKIYGEPTCRLRAMAFIAAIAAKTIRKAPTLRYLRECIDWRELAVEPPKPAAPGSLNSRLRAAEDLHA